MSRIHHRIGWLTASANQTPDHPETHRSVFGTQFVDPATVRARHGYTLRANGVTSEAPPVAGLALQVKDLHVSYGPKRAVDGVSLAVNEGEIFRLPVRFSSARSTFEPTPGWPKR
jgi:hypothetical protein